MCFDWAVLQNPESFSAADKINNDGVPRSEFFKPNNYIYKMIETMLPKAMVDEKKKHIRLLELWALDERPRKGWTKIIQN